MKRGCIYIRMTGSIRLPSELRATAAVNKFGKPTMPLWIVKKWYWAMFNHTCHAPTMAGWFHQLHTERNYLNYSQSRFRESAENGGFSFTRNIIGAMKVSPLLSHTWFSIKSYWATQIFTTGGPWDNIWSDGGLRSNVDLFWGHWHKKIWKPLH